MLGAFLSGAVSLQWKKCLKGIQRTIRNSLFHRHQRLTACTQPVSHKSFGTEICRSLARLASSSDYLCGFLFAGNSLELKDTAFNLVPRCWCLLLIWNKSKFIFTLTIGCVILGKLHCTSLCYDKNNDICCTNLAVSHEITSHALEPTFWVSDQFSHLSITCGVGGFQLPPVSFPMLGLMCKKTIRPYLHHEINLWIKDHHSARSVLSLGNFPKEAVGKHPSHYQHKQYCAEFHRRCFVNLSSPILDVFPFRVYFIYLLPANENLPDKGSSCSYGILIFPWKPPSVGALEVRVIWE